MCEQLKSAARGTTRLVLGLIFRARQQPSGRLRGEIVYDLEADAYNDLVSRAGTGALPFLLVLLCIPKDDAVWLDVSADRLILQKCAYWLQLDGVLTSNEATKRVRIPAANVFTPKSVADILQAVKTGAMKP